jgi:hypothetical protein
LVLSNTKRGYIIGPSFLSSGGSIGVVWVKGVFRAAAREGFGEMVQCNEVGLGDSFMVTGH